MPTFLTRRHLVIFVAVMTLFVGAALALSAIARPSAQTASRPLVARPTSPLDHDFADPFVLRQDETYYAFATGVAGAHVQVATSRDLTSWTPGGDALPRLPKWALPSAAFTWAPSVLVRDRRYVLYYTARHLASGFQCISRAVADRPEGPYVDTSKRPFVCQVGGSESLCGSIDPSPFVDTNGKSYLLWKSDENSSSCKTAPRIWSQQLSDDGMELVGAPEALLTKDQPWEGDVIEGPSMIVSASRYLLFYSANRYDSAQYGVGYATCQGPQGPCTKVTVAAPLLNSQKEVLGPGGQEFFTDPLGTLWMAYHAWTSRTTYAAGGARSLRLLRFTLPAPLTEPTNLVAGP